MTDTNWDLEEQTHLRKKEGIWQHFWEDHRATDQKVNSQIFSCVVESECQETVEEPATTQAKEGVADSAEAGDMGAPATLWSFDPQREKGKMVHLDDFTSYQGTTQDEWS
jgi:hypothetical protein